MPQHRQSVLIIILVSLITFSNALSNGFVGDDHLIVVNNTFYETWANFPKLFTPGYITDSDEAFNFESFSHTGSVAYRPVLSATFFFDYWLWQRAAFGYHLHNVVVHVLNAILVYFIFFLILKDPALSLFGAVLFAVHPLKSEAVCAIGYRADLLAAFFFLLAFLSYILRERCGAAGRPPAFAASLARGGLLPQGVSSRREPIGRPSGGKRKVIEALSHVALLLALFSKESAVVFVGILVAYDVLVKEEKMSDVLKHFYGRYLGHLLITLFYLYIYFYVFRNSAMDNARLLGGNIFTHATVAVDIFVQYLTGFILPLTVKVLPPLYAPPAAGYAAWAGLILSIFLMYKICRKPIGSLREEKTAVFFVAWFLIALIPVANIIPLINPMAYRFLYLPSIGFLAVAAILLNKWGVSLDKFLHSAPRSGSGARVGAALCWGIVVLCAITTFSLNMAWKSNLVMAAMMARDFPTNPTGYLHLGMEYFRIGAVDKTREALEKGFELGMDDPRGYYFMGLCYLHDWRRSGPYYEKSIRLFPRYALSYVGLGRIYVLGGHYTEAIPYLEKAIALSPSYTGYGYLIQAYQRTGRDDDALAVYRQAQSTLKERSHLESLEKFIKEGKKLRGSVDIGI